MNNLSFRTRVYFGLCKYLDIMFLVEIRYIFSDYEKFRKAENFLLTFFFKLSIKGVIAPERDRERKRKSNEELLRVGKLSCDVTAPHGLAVIDRLIDAVIKSREQNSAFVLRTKGV